MDFTVTAKGPTLDQLTRDTARDLRAANRKAGRDLGKVGKAAMSKGAPRMFGKALTVKPKVDAWPTRCSVEFNPATIRVSSLHVHRRRGGFLTRMKGSRYKRASHVASFASFL